MDVDFDLIERYILKVVAEGRFPSISLGIVEDGVIKYLRSFGFRDVESSLPATPETSYCLGSVTKSFTAIAVMQLYEKGLLDLQDPVGKYVDLNLKAFDEEITIHNLLTHTSGIPALGYAEALIDSYYGIRDVWLPITSPDDVLTFMKDYERWVMYKPGLRWFYLNEGYVILGKVIEKVSKISYEEYVRKNILSKLGMSRSYFSIADYLNDGNKATPYIITKDGLKLTKPIFGITADGGLFSNASDLSKYVLTLINRGSLNNEVILSRESLEIMEQPHVKLPYESFTSDAYGYGLTVKENFLGYKLIGHSGSVYVYTAYMGYIPSRKLGVVLLANASSKPLSLVGAYILTYLLGEDPEKLPYVVLDRLYKKLEGTYEGYMKTVELRIRRSGDTLFLVEKDKEGETLTPLIPHKIEENYALFHILTLAGKVPVEFFIKNEKDIIMIYERYKLIKR
ncbi:MAG: hypothetical protein B7O98_01940 [Zestosphaera tikiterensis]|uniref:Serine hydrolase n=1 Tax=Zestosphaera tikiterensis TaxID=1973259 RepID=A0A2R7Y7C7_9CREN|nr:MAG: hypothetical protein B7O98_01940 [Zestosphaera tikiterensis]